ncbi:hypothetical protein O9X98_25490 [Agrobacterium salinitolerans]|nr:hypothetical protein [Agrobacterium salinitolerans]
MDVVKLEIVKLAVQALTPAVVGYLGWKVSKRLKDIEQAQWGNRKLTEKRIQIYEKVSPLLNRLFCYFAYVGDWQSHTPKAIIATKRELDHEMHINKYLLEPEVFEAYQRFIDALFELYTGAGKDAKMKTLISSSNGDRKTSPHFKWDSAFNDCFRKGEFSSKREVAELYDAVMKAQRIGIKA